MALLALNGVWKRYRRGRHGGRERVALRAVSLELDAGELVAVVGRRRSGRTTLLQVAAGMEPPTVGTVRFDGVDLARRPMLGAPGGIGYCTTRFTDTIGTTVVEHVAAPLLGLAVASTRAHAQAIELLRRVGLADCADLLPDELHPTESMRAGIARALVTRPRLLLMDEPTLEVRLTQRDEMLDAIRSIAHEDGVAVLSTVESASELAGCDRALSLDEGELHGETVPYEAPVVPLQSLRARPSA